ncbi:ATP-binding protein [Flavobacterium amniphilum]|uniref:AAA family ATPase n=1 Tax=Flavobacterium amniphilum TaxID=1834035 RepID=UPI00202A490E|nr:ATP-binding protein [Flavobacterium amniphilum]MCL9804220.1 ATP-binding protein [Flavobacterium amniphilum]
MIVEFSVKNFRSIKDLQTISFAITGLKSAKQYKYVDLNNISEEHSQKCFNVIGLYGANASGKSNLIKAFQYFIDLMSKPSTSKSELSDLNQPHLFQDDLNNSESFFQLIFVLNKKKYRYGFTVKSNQDIGLDEIKNYNSEEIITNEWLFSDVEKNMVSLFVREGNRILTNNLQNQSKIPTDNLYRHNLFLVHAAAFDFTGECKKITDYFSAFTISELEFDNAKFRWMSILMLRDIKKKEKFIKMLSSFNINISDIELEDYTEKDIFPQEKINFIKYFNNKKIKLNLKYNESAGTQKMFDLIGLLLLTFSFDKPAFVILDEIDSHFHPALLINLVRMFNNPEINKSKSQLLFTSHDTNLLSPKLMRRDQFYFAEKAIDNATKIYSLADLRGVRNTADFAKEYLAGHYGGLPILHEYCDSDNVNRSTDE